MTTTTTAPAEPRTPAALPGPRPRTPGWKRLQRAVQYALMVLLALFCVVPFAWVVFTAVDADGGPTIGLPAFTLDNFVRFFTDGGTPGCS